MCVPRLWHMCPACFFSVEEWPRQAVSFGAFEITCRRRPHLSKVLAWVLLLGRQGVLTVFRFAGERRPLFVACTNYFSFNKA